MNIEDIAVAASEPEGASDFTLSFSLDAIQALSYEQIGKVMHALKGVGVPGHWRLSVDEDYRNEN